MKVSHGYLSLEATEAPLVQIFQEIGKQAKITIDSNIGPEEKVTIHLDRVPLEEGIRAARQKCNCLLYARIPRIKLAASKGWSYCLKEKACPGRPKHPRSRKRLKSLPPGGRKLPSRRSLSHSSSSSILQNLPGKRRRRTAVMIRNRHE